MATPLQEATSDALVRLAQADSRLRVVSGPDPGPAIAWFAQVWRERVVTVSGPSARGAVADGLRLLGCKVVVALDRDTHELHGDLGDGHVLLTDHAGSLGAAHRAGLTVMQPAWRTDIEPLLGAALVGAKTTLLRLHAQAVGDPRGGQDAPPRPGEHRVVHRGSAGLVLGAGATAGVLADVARMLAGREIHVTAIDAHTIRPRTGIDAALTDGHLLVGALDADEAEALTPVPVTPGSPIETMRAVLDALRTPKTRVRLVAKGSQQS